MCQIINPVQVSDAFLHDHFLELLPRVETHGRIFFRHVKCRETRAECIAEMIALAWRWFVRLMKRGKDPNTFKFNFCRFAAFAVKSGRRLCRMERPNDVLSERAQRERGFKVESLPVSTATAHENLYAKVHGQREHDAYEERLKDNTVSPIPDQVAFRLDFPQWLLTWSERDRRIIKDMAQDERTFDLAQKFGCSPARISQKRTEYRDDWNRFCGDTAGCCRSLIVHRKREASMGAKQKLNASYINGAVVMAALMGWLTGSWIVFWLVLIALLASAIGSGNIR